MNLTSRRDRQRLITAIERAGHHHRWSSKGHLIVYALNGTVAAVLAGTPSDHRSHRNSQADLRRAGINLPG